MDLNLKLFKLNEEGQFSITKPFESKQIITCMKNYIQVLSDKIITDTCSCMGGDTINFSRNFRVVNGIEILLENFKLLEENCKIFNCLNVNLFCQDYLEIFDILKQDIIYIDPKWGGRDYRLRDNISLKLGKFHIWELINMIKDKHLTKFIFIKAPLNVCLNNIDYDSIHVIYNKSQLPSFKLICIRL